MTQGKLICLRGLLCPNGDKCTGTGACFVPADANGNVQCLASKLTAPATVARNVPVPAAHPVAPGVAEGRAYNAHLFKQTGSTPGYQSSAFAKPLPMTGAFFRIHTSHSMNPGASSTTPHTCQLPDMSDQIGCLVDASPCSLGYASGRTLAANANIAGVKVKSQSPLPLCAQRNFTYPLANKIYLNSVSGFAATSGQELQLAGCMTDVAQTNLTPATPPNLVTASIAAAGLVPIPSFINAGKTFCEDFNERQLCGAGSNSDACLNPTPNFGSFPAFETVCGDGQVDSLEECDRGTTNGPPPAACSTTCRLN